MEKKGEEEEKEERTDKWLDEQANKLPEEKPKDKR